MFLMEMISCFVLASIYMKVQQARSNLIVNAVTLTLTLYLCNSMTTFLHGTF